MQQAKVIFKNNAYARAIEHCRSSERGAFQYHLHEILTSDQWEGAQARLTISLAWNFGYRFEGVK